MAESDRTRDLDRAAAAMRLLAKPFARDDLLACVTGIIACAEA